MCCVLTLQGRFVYLPYKLTSLENAQQPTYFKLSPPIFLGQSIQRHWWNICLCYPNFVNLVTIPLKMCVNYYQPQQAFEDTDSVFESERKDLITAVNQKKCHFHHLSFPSCLRRRCDILSEEGQRERDWHSQLKTSSPLFLSSFTLFYSLYNSNVLIQSLLHTYSLIRLFSFVIFCTLRLSLRSLYIFPCYSSTLVTGPLSSD